MSENNGNVLTYKVDELLQWKNKTQSTIDLITNYKDDIKDLNVMREQIANINEKINKQESHRRQMSYLLWGTVISGLAGLLFQILKSL